MEILIRLAGVQLGPYSEEQVRQHISEGLLSLKDTAKIKDKSDWAPLSDVLEGKAPADPEAVAEPEPPAAPAPVAEAPVEEEEVPEPPKRAPAAPPGVMHLPSRSQEPDEEVEPSDVGAQSKKTILIEPTAPIRPAGMGPTSTSIATTSPLVPAEQSAKKTSRAALVKALAQKTSPLPTKAIIAPARPPVPPSIPVPPVREPKKSAPPGLVEDAGVKTVPMRNAPAAPPLPSMMPTTTPLPTRAILKPDPATAPSAKVEKAPAQKGEPPARPESVPTPPPLKEDLEVATSKIPPPVFKREEPPPRRTPGKPADKPADKLADKAPEKPAEPKPPKKPTRWLPRILAAWAVLAAFMLYYVWSPYHAAAALRTALDTGDAVGLDAGVDFPAVRYSLKTQVSDQVAQVGVQARSSDAVLAILNSSIDAYVTPEGIAGLVNKTETAAPADSAQLISSAEASKILLAFNTQPVRNQGLASVGDFVVDRGAAILHLRFTGLGWQLKRVELRPDLTTRPTPSATAPLLTPVTDTYLERGAAKVKSNDAKGAIADFTQVLAIDPQSSAALNERATVRESVGDLDGAIKDYTDALAIDPQMAAAYNGRGNAKASKNDQDGAIADFNQAVHFDPTLATAYDSRGNAKIVKDDPDGAIADFTQAISIDPNLASAYSDRGFARQANGNPDGAIADYTAALALKPKTARTYFNRGLARQAQGNLDAAIVDFDHALAFDPKIADAYYYRGNAKGANHDLDGAIADYTQALALNPKIANAFSNRGLARQAQGDLDGALSDYKHALDLDPKNAQAYSTRGFAKLTKGNLDGALTDLKQFCDLAPRDHNADHARLYLWLISKAQNSGAEADQDLSAAMESSWNSPPDDINTKTGSYLLGRLNEADYLAGATSADAKADQAQHCLAWYFAGMKRALMGDKKGAIDAFHQCVATGQKDFAEYVLAQAELKALEPTPPPAPAAPVAAPLRAP